MTRDERKYIKDKDPQTLNLYEYCDDNPVSNTDPSGDLSGSITFSVEIPVVSKFITTSASVDLSNGDIYGNASLGALVGVSVGYSYDKPTPGTSIVAGCDVGAGITDNYNLATKKVSDSFDLGLGGGYGIQQTSQPIHPLEILNNAWNSVRSLF